MIDIHSHILPGIDDGCESMEESLKVLKKAYSRGVTDLVVTPHFILGSTYDLDNVGKKKKLEELKKEATKAKIPIRLYLGNEVFVENNLLDLIRQGKITTLNNSRYLLFELPMNNVYAGLDDLLFHLRSTGCYPVIAHPERYELFKKDPTLIEGLIDKGALFQCNIGSFFGRYGERAQKLVMLLLKHHAIHFLSSDVHHDHDLYYDEIKELKELLKEHISREEIEDLFVNNARHVLNDEPIETKSSIPIQKTLFGHWK